MCAEAQSIQDALVLCLHLIAKLDTVYYHTTCTRFTPSLPGMLQVNNFPPMVFSLPCQLHLNPNDFSSTDNTTFILHFNVNLQSAAQLYFLLQVKREFGLLSCYPLCLVYLHLFEFINITIDFMPIKIFYVAIFRKVHQQENFLLIWKCRFFPKNSLWPRRC